MKEYSANIEAKFTLKIKDDSFRPGRVRVHIPAPINASQLSEGQILDFDPIFRIVSVEDYPQRSIWYNEVLEHNIPFMAAFAFTNTVRCITPDIDLIDRTEQPGFTAEQLARFAASHSCDCGSYTGPAFDRVTMMDLAGEAHLDISDPAESVPEGLTYLPFGKRLKTIFEYCASCPTTDVVSTHSTNVASTVSAEAGVVDSTNVVSTDIHTTDVVSEHCTNPSSGRNLKFVRLCRRFGIPARWQGGILCESSLDPVPSDWALVYAAPYGWFFVDVERYRALKLGHIKKTGLTTDPFDDPDLYFGGIDPYRMPTASKFGAGLYPAKDFLRADMLTNVRGEVEYADRGLASDEYTTAVEFTISALQES